MSTGMLIDGIAASEALDSSGEILKVDGCDISSLTVDGVINWEHRDETSPGASPSDIVGKVLFARKIFSVKDCENDRQLKYWKSLELPFIYFVARLYDGAGSQAAKDLAAQFRDHVANGEPIIVRYSIEGTTLETTDNKKVLKRSIARRIAATIKPCNRSAVSGILSDPNAPEGWAKDPEKVEDKDFLEEVLKRSERLPHPNFTRLGGAVAIQGNPVVEDGDFSPVTKTLTAGGMDAAPSTLTGGSALQRQDLSSQIQGWGQKAKRAVKAWDVDKGELRAYLKAEVPEASDAYLDRFASMVEDHDFKTRGLNLKKTMRRLQVLGIELRKAKEGLVAGKVKGTKGQAKPGVETNQPMIQWQGQTVRPGKAKAWSAGATGGKVETFDVLGGDDTHHFMLPQGLVGGDWGHKDIQKHRRSTVDMLYPPTAVEQPQVLDHARHGHALNTSSAQKALIHGLDLSGPSTAPRGGTFRSDRNRWMKNAGGAPTFVKGEAYFSDAMEDGHKELAFHNIARDFFGMGPHLPTVASFTHPRTGEKMTAIQGLSDSRHPELDLGDSLKNPEDRKALLRGHDRGEVPRAAIMDFVLGNEDRNVGNWMLGPDGGLKLLDHGLAFHDSHQPFEDVSPNYLLHWGDAHDQARGEPPGSWRNQPIPESIQSWARGLDAGKLNQHLVQNQVPELERVATLGRLQDLQRHLGNEDIVHDWRTFLNGME